MVATAKEEIIKKEREKQVPLEIQEHAQQNQCLYMMLLLKWLYMFNVT